MRRWIWVLGLAIWACDDGAGGEVPDPDQAALDGAVDAGAADMAEPEPDGAMIDMQAPDAAPPEGCEAPAPADELEVVTAQGTVRGVDAGEGVAAFLGLPFAAPPLGDLRFEKPRLPACYEGVFQANAFGPECVQMDGADAVTGSEDCLQLNVWRPSGGDGPAPVMVFVHGGGNTQSSATVGAGQQVLYDGARLAQRGVVVVTIQYRLGPLGWLVHESLDDAEGRSGNLGTLDQIAALQWVQANIAAFGGDPARVMVFGESAGAVNTCMLMASPLAAGLFQVAAMQSGGCPARGREVIAAESQAQVDAVGCGQADDVAACLRALPAEQLLLPRPPVVDVAGTGSSLFQPHIDGWVLPEAPEAILQRGEGNAAALIVGANSDETSRTAPPLETAAAYEALVRQTLGRAADQALALYPADAYDTPRAAYVQLSSDAKFVCSARAVARASAAGGVSTYLYHFAQPLTQAPRLAAFGAYHAIELFFVWDNLDFAGYRPSAAERALATTVGGYWTRFAATGGPNGGGAVEWPMYDAATDRHLLLVGGGVEAGEGLRRDKCDFWDSLAGR